jgi:hypothetical protein
LSSVTLYFVSFWNAAIDLNELASYAYYIGGITGQSDGHGAPSSSLV